MVFRSWTAWGKKQLYNLAVLLLMLQNCLPHGRGVVSPWRAVGVFHNAAGLRDAAGCVDVLQAW